MTRIGILSNARSTRNKTSMQGINEVLARHADVKHLLFHEIGELSTALQKMAAENITHLVISGGDGTVQAAINCLVKERPFATMPALSLIPSGMTNVIAMDVGVRGKPAQALQRVIERIKAGDPGTSLDRSLIGVSFDGGKSKTYGFLAGAVAFYQGTMLSRQKVHKVGMRQALAANITILLSFLRLLRHGPGPRSGFTGERLKVGRTESTAQEREIFLVLLTTLHRLLPGVMPFWGDCSKPVRYTLVDHPPARLCRAILPVVFGRPRPWMDTMGYQSGSLDDLYLTLRTPFVMDGELFMPDPVEGVRISAGPVIRFHRF